MEENREPGAVKGTELQDEDLLSKKRDVSEGRDNFLLLYRKKAGMGTQKRGEGGSSADPPIDTNNISDKNC